MRNGGDQQWPDLGLVALAAVLSVALVSCGSGDHTVRADQPSGEEQVARALKTYVEAQAEGDGKRACAQLTRKQQRVQSESLGPGSSCVAAIERLARLVPPDGDVVEVRTVRLLSGDRAEAIVDFPRERDRADFRKVGDTWKIDSFNELSSTE